MARESRPRYASIKPSEAEGGGQFGFPAGATVTITEASWVPAEEIGEKFLKGGRGPDDPVLRLVGEVEGSDGDPVEEVLGAGKAARLIASKDGEHLEIPDGSTATALHSSTDAKFFLNTLMGKPGDKKCEAYKRHKSKMLDESSGDDGISAALVGLKFVVGREVVPRDFGDQREGKPRPTLVCDEILEPPTGEGNAKKGGKGKTTRKDEDEERPARRTSRASRDEDETEPPARSKKRGRDEDEGDDEADAEKAVLEALDLPKWRKGLPVDSAFSAVHSLVRGQDNHKAIVELVEDDKWLTHKGRPWAYDKEDQLLTKVD